jgi:hypothetical protein
MAERRWPRRTLAKRATLTRLLELYRPLCCKEQCCAMKANTFRINPSRVSPRCPQGNSKGTPRVPEVSPPRCHPKGLHSVAAIASASSRATLSNGIALGWHAPSRGERNAVLCARASKLQIALLTFGVVGNLLQQIDPGSMEVFLGGLLGASVGAGNPQGTPRVLEVSPPKVSP